jgi:hypothetical protein
MYANSQGGIMKKISKITDSIRIRIFFIFLIAVLFLIIQLNAQSKGEIGIAKVSKQVVPNSSQGLKMVADILDVVGGKSESDSFKMVISAGGQPSPIGKSQSSAYKVYAGFVHASFVRHGDVNGNGQVDLGDVVYLITYLYKAGPEPIPMEAGDLNCNGTVDLGDVVYIITYLYKAGPPPCS